MYRYYQIVHSDLDSSWISWTASFKCPHGYVITLGPPCTKIMFLFFYNELVNVLGYPAILCQDYIYKFEKIAQMHIFQTLLPGYCYVLYSIGTEHACSSAAG